MDSPSWLYPDGEYALGDSMKIFQIPFQQKRAKIWERVNIVAISDIPSGQLDPVGNVAVFLADNQRPQGLCPPVGGLDLHRDQL